MWKRRQRVSMDPGESSLPAPEPPPVPEVPSEPMWAPDPFGRFQWRYWDGARRTAHVSSWYRQEIDSDFVEP